MKKLPAGALLLFGLVLAASLDPGSAVWAQQGGGSGTNQHRISAMSHNPSPAGQSTSGVSSPSSVSLTGTWRLAWMSHTAPTTLTLQQDGNRITGTLGTTPIEGTVDGSRIHFTMRDFQGVVHDYTGKLDWPGVLSGDETAPQEDISWRATRPVAASAAAPAAHPATAAAAPVAHPAPAPANPAPAAASAPAVVAPAGKGYRCVFDLHQGTQSIRYSAGPIVTEASQPALSEAWKNYIMATYHPSGKVQHAGCPVLQGRPENWDRAVSAWEANSNQLGVPTTHVNWTSAPKK